MKFNTALILAVLLCGCKKPAGPARWEYKVVTAENYAHHSEDQAVKETNISASVDDTAYAEHTSGTFYFDGTSDLNDAGRDGWELVSAIPQTETVQVDNDHWGHFNNIRTGNVILIFKRPQQP